MQLGGSPAEQLGQVEVVAHQVLGESARLVVGQLEQRRQLIGVRRQALTLGEQALVVAPEGAQGVAPGVALVGNQLVQHGDRRRLVVTPRVSILEGAAQGGHVREPGPVGEEAPDLEVGILAGLQLAEELHDEAVAE